MKKPKLLGDRSLGPFGAEKKSSQLAVDNFSSSAENRHTVVRNAKPQQLLSDLLAPICTFQPPSPSKTQRAR